jgi:hypothetical protein
MSGPAWRGGEGAVLRRALKFAGMLAGVLAAWIAVLAGLAFTAAPGEALAFVAWPGRAVAVVGRAGGSYEPLGGGATLTRSAESGFVARLYRSGALLVIDARVVIACRGLFSTEDQTFPANSS